MPRLLLYFVLFIGIMGRVYLAISLPLWHDEAYSIWASQEPLARILSGATDPVHPPGYYLFIKLWSLISDHLVWLRLSSIFFAIVNVYALFILVKKHLHQIVTPIACVVMYMLSGYFIIFDWQVRMYSGLMTCTLFSFLLFISLYEKASIKKLIFFTILNLLGLYFDYGFLWYYLPLILVSMWILGTKKSIGSMLATCSLVLSGLLFLLIHPTVLSTFTKGIEGISWMQPYLNPLFFLPYFLGSHNQIIATGIISFLTFLGLFPNFKTHTYSWVLSVFLIITSVSCCVALYYSVFFAPLFHVRSFQIVGISILLLCSNGLSQLYRKKQYRFLAGFLLALYINFIYILASFPFQPGQYLVSFFPWKEIRQKIDHNAQLVYLHPLPDLNTPMLLWGLKYTLQGKEVLFSPLIPHQMAYDVSVIPKNCTKLTTSLVEIYSCK